MTQRSPPRRTLSSSGSATDTQIRLNQGAPDRLVQYSYSLQKNDGGASDDPGHIFTSDRISDPVRGQEHDGMPVSGLAVKENGMHRSTVGPNSSHHSGLAGHHTSTSKPASSYSSHGDDFASSSQRGSTGPMLSQGIRSFALSQHVPATPNAAIEPDPEPVHAASFPSRQQLQITAGSACAVSSSDSRQEQITAGMPHAS